MRLWDKLRFCSNKQSDGERMNNNELNQQIDPSQLASAETGYFDEGESSHYGSVILHSLDQALDQEKLQAIPYTQNEDGSFKKIHIPTEGGYASVLQNGNVVTTFDPSTLDDPTKDTDVYYIVYYSLVGQETANLSNQTQTIELDHFYSVSTSGDEMWPATFGPITITSDLNQTFGKNRSIWTEGNYIDAGRNSVDISAQKMDENGQPIPETRIGKYTLTSKGAHRGATITFELTDVTYKGPIAPAYVILSDRHFDYIGFVRFQPQIIRGKVSDPSTVGWQGKAQHAPIKIQNNLPVITQEDNPVIDPFYQQAIPQKKTEKQPLSIEVKDIKFWVNGKATAAQSLDAVSNNEKVGTYQINRSKKEIIYQPTKSFVGRPQPVEFIAYGSDGHSYLGTFNQVVLGIELQNTHALQGVTQTSQITIVSNPNEPGKPLADNLSVDFLENGETSKQVDAVKNGQKVGVYQVDQASGVVSFVPDSNFVGQPDQVTVRVISTSGEQILLQYQPTVDPVRPTARIAPTIGEQGQSQTSKVRISSGSDQVLARIDANHPARFMINGQVSNAEKITISGIGSYILEPTTGLVTFSPDFEYFGKPKGIQIQVTDDNNTPAVATYNVTVLQQQAPQAQPTADDNQEVVEESPSGQTVVHQPVNQETQPQSSQTVQQATEQAEVEVTEQATAAQEVVVEVESQAQTEQPTEPQAQPEQVVSQEVVHETAAQQVTQQTQPQATGQVQAQPTAPAQPVQQSSQAENGQGPENASELPMIDDTNAWYLMAIALLGALSATDDNQEQ